LRLKHPKIVAQTHKYNTRKHTPLGAQKGFI